MVQRIQTVFLLIAATALALMLTYPLVKTSVPEASGLYQDGLLYTQENLPSTVIIGLAILLCIVAIFLFKKRRLQIQFVILAVVFILAGNVIGGYSFLQPTLQIRSVHQATLTPGLGAFMPIVGLICLFLAYRGIRKDEKIVKSMDRLR